MSAIIRILPVLFSLAACSGGESTGAAPSASPLCGAMGGGSAMVAATAEPGSAFGNEAAAFDGNFASHATLTAVSGSGGGTLRGTAQGGVVASAGMIAGIAISRPGEGAYQFTVNTYLDGAPADSAPAASRSYDSPGVQNCISQHCLEREEGSFFGIETTLPFDAIEAVISIAGTQHPLQVQELCIR